MLKATDLSVAFHFTVQQTGWPLLWLTDARIAEVVYLFDDFEQGFGTLGLVLDGFGRLMSLGDERFVVSRADDEQESVKFLISGQIELVDERAKLGQSVFFD